MVTKKITCAVCGAEFDGHPLSKYCPACKKTAYLRKSLEVTTRYQKGLSRKIGSIDRCQICGEDYTVTNGPQRYCKQCSLALNRDKHRVGYHAKIGDPVQPTVVINPDIGHNPNNRDVVDSDSLTERRCIVCGRPFKSAGKVTICSDACRKQRHKALSYESFLRRRKKINEVEGKIMILTKLTGQESGIIVYGEKSVAVVNWGSCGDDQLPMLSPLGGEMIPWTEEGLLDGAKRRVVDDVRDELPGTVWMTDDVAPDGTRSADSDMDIVYDRNCDLIRLFLDAALTDDDRAGIVYDLRSGRKVIVIPAWDGQPISIQTIARRAGMSCRKLAERFGIPYRTMEQWSAGEHLPAPYVIRMIREILGV